MFLTIAGATIVIKHHLIMMIGKIIHTVNKKYNSI